MDIRLYLVDTWDAKCLSCCFSAVLDRRFAWSDGKVILVTNHMARLAILMVKQFLNSIVVDLLLNIDMHRPFE